MQRQRFFHLLMHFLNVCSSQEGTRSLELHVGLPRGCQERHN